MFLQIISVSGEKITVIRFFTPFETVLLLCKSRIQMQTQFYILPTSWGLLSSTYILLMEMSKSADRVFAWKMQQFSPRLWCSSEMMHLNQFVHSICFASLGKIMLTRSPVVTYYPTIWLSNYHQVLVRVIYMHIFSISSRERMEEWQGEGGGFANLEKLKEYHRNSYLNWLKF